MIIRKNLAPARNLYQNKMGFHPVQSSSHYIWLEKLISPLEQEKTATTVPELSVQEKEQGITKNKNHIKNFIKKMIAWKMILGVGTIALLYLVKKYYSLPKVTHLLKVGSRLME